VTIVAKQGLFSLLTPECCERPLDFGGRRLYLFVA
jgi:hypothetical protein